MRGLALLLALALVSPAHPAQAQKIPAQKENGDAVLGQQGAVQFVRVQKSPRLTGTCHPTHVHFDGLIQTDGPAFVTYRWIRSDGKRTDGVVRFTEGFKGHGVGTTWDQTETTTGWVQLVVLYPKRVESPKRYFTVHCGT